MNDLFIRTTGAGRDVVLIHGLPQPPSDLEPLADSLASDFRTHVVHLPGYGSSPEVSGGYDLEDVAREIAAALRSRDVREAAFVGCSGGFYRAAQLVLAAEPPTGWALVGLGAVAGLDAGTSEAFRGTAAAIRSGADLSGAMVDRMLSPSFAAEHPDARARVGAMLQAASPGCIAAELEAFADAPDLLPSLGALEIPVYLRVGELDVAAPQAMSRAIADATPGARLEVVPGAGHLLLLEDFEDTRDAVARALSG